MSNMSSNMKLRSKQSSRRAITLLTFLVIIHAIGFISLRNRELFPALVLKKYTKQQQHVSDSKGSSSTKPIIKDVTIIDTEKDEDDDSEDPSKYGILMIHYHKTGFVLSRQLRSHAIEYLPSAIASPPLSKNNNTNTLSKNVNNNPTNTSKVDFKIPQKSWGSINQPRKFNESTKCPNKFDLQMGVINVQESPDFYCNIEDMALLFDSMKEDTLDAVDRVEEYRTRRGTKIIHFVRDPYSMALSNYYYHAQDPTPEPWVKKHNPCELEYVNSTESLADVLFPFLLADGSTILTKNDFHEIAKVCRSLYRTNSDLANEYFEGHLHRLDPSDGLKLSTAQMMIRGGGVTRVAGGDMLRMANNIIKLKQLQSSEANGNINGQGRAQKLTIVTVSMDDFIANPVKFTTTYLNFLLGDDAHIVAPKRLKAIAKKFEKKYASIIDQGGKHVTHGKYDNREQLKDLLKNDPLFGPILDRTKKIVDEALMGKYSA